MGRFDIEYSKYIPTASPGLAKANIDVDTGEAELSRSIANFGEMLRSLGQAEQKKQDTLDMGELTNADVDDWATTESNAINYGGNPQSGGE